MAPATNEGDVIQQGCPGDLLQGLNDVIDVYMAHQHPQPEAALQLLYAVMNVVRLQEVESADTTQEQSQQSVHAPSTRPPWWEIKNLLVKSAFKVLKKIVRMSSDSSEMRSDPFVFSAS